MHARELVELAVLVSLHGKALAQSAGRVPYENLEQYWTLSKCRLDHWGLALRRFRSSATATGGISPSAKQTPPLGAMEEILTGEVLTRVWTAVLCSCDRRRQQIEAEPIARSVLIGHLEARHRVLNLIVHSAQIEPEQAVWLNRVRRRAQHWTDMLVANLLSAGDVSEFAMDPRRAWALCRALNRHHGRAWPVLLASVRAAFRGNSSVRSPNVELNAKIASSILACFEPELFDSTGLPRSVWLAQVMSTTDDTQGMIDELFRAEQEPEVANDEAPFPPGSPTGQAKPRTDAPPFERRRF